MSGGFTYRVPYDCTQPCSVKAKPWSCSPKYSTMSFRSNSRCTSTSSPSSSCSLSVRAIWSAIKASYSCGVSLPSWSFFRAARTSAVCGNEPIVVVGNTGRRSCRLRRAACGEARRMSFSLTPVARALEQPERRAEIGAPDVAPVDHPQREHPTLGPGLEQLVELPCPRPHEIDVQPCHGEVPRRRKVVVEPREICRDE